MTDVGTVDGGLSRWFDFFGLNYAFINLPKQYLVFH